MRKTVTSCVKNTVKEYRVAKGLSQYALEKLTDSAHPFVYLVEEQRSQPGIQKIAQLCIVLKCTPEELFYFDFAPVYEIMKELKKE